MRDYLLYLTDEVEEEFALWANQARQQLWDPGQPLDGWDHQVPEVTPEVMVKKVLKLELFKHNLELLFEGLQLCFNANTVHVYQLSPFMLEY